MTDGALRVLCTDRSAHPSVDLDVAFDAEWKSYKVKCPRCGRDFQLKQDKWVRLIDGLAAADIDHFDISMMPSFHNGGMR